MRLLVFFDTGTTTAESASERAVSSPPLQMEAAGLSRTSGLAADLGAKEVEGEAKGPGGLVGTSASTMNDWVEMGMGMRPVEGMGCCCGDG